MPAFAGFRRHHVVMKQVNQWESVLVDLRQDSSRQNQDAVQISASRLDLAKTTTEFLYSTMSVSMCNGEAGVEPNTHCLPSTASRVSLVRLAGDLRLVKEVTTVES